MSAPQALHPVATRCRVLGLSPSGFSAWRARPLSARAKTDLALRAEIEAIHTRSRGPYGVPRLHAELADPGIRVGRKRVVRLMRTAGLVGVSRRTARRTTVRDERARPAPDLVARGFTAERPNPLWVADLTSIATWTGFLDLAVVLDVWSRRIVGWAMAPHLRTERVLTALEMALTHRRPGAVIHHSDQGGQDTALAFGQRCREARVRPSMGSVGDADDNALCESFCATLETERLDRRSVRSQAEARMAVFACIEGWDNPLRRHSALDYASPIEFERRHRAAA